MRKKLYSLSLTLAAVVLLVSCGKPKDTVATVTVLDAGNLPVAGATVKVVGYDSFGNNPGVIDRETTTDANGKAIFNFNDLYKRGSAGFAVLEIEAEKGAMMGDGIIKVEEEKNNEQTITIQ